jgi:DNA primase
MSIRENSAHCFVCNASADIFDYIMRKFNAQFPEAMAILNNDFSIGLDLNAKVDKVAFSKMENDRKVLFAVKRKYAEYKRNWLDGRRYEWLHFGKEPEGEPLSFDRWREVMGV